MPRERTAHSKHPLLTAQEMPLHMDITRWSILKSDIIFFTAEDGEALYSQQKQDQELTVAHELLIVKFRLKLNKVGKTTRPFRYDLKQIPYEYRVEVTNKFKGFDLIDRCLKN